jgi:DNA-directed RNA polymerase subunit RPC12/RpoP
MDDVSAWECPNCGGNALMEIALDKYRCTYCGTILTPHKTTLSQTRCPHCGLDNERGDGYCDYCGAMLAGQAFRISKIDLAVISLVATFFGSMFIPLVGPILGLILGYKALQDARAGDEKKGSERLAQVAVGAGWVVTAMSVLPLCLFPGMAGIQWGCSICERLFEMLGSLASDVLR